jgi:hypothetical protein
MKAPRTFADVLSVARDADRRFRRVVVFFEALFAVAVVGGVVLDRLPPRPRLECTAHRAQFMSPYPHPYGEPPPSDWATCVWEPRRAPQASWQTASSR